MTVLRFVLMIVGLILIGAAAHSSITATGGYASPSAVMTLAIAFGVAAGAIGLGMAAGEKRGVLAFVMFVSLVCAESFNVVSSFERVIVAREAQAAPLRAAALAYEAAVARVAKAQKLVDELGTSDRLRAAEAAKAKADAAVQASAADKSCAANCRTLLEAQVTNAQTEVAQARAEVEASQARARADLNTARAELLLAPPPPSTSPLADRLGIAPWALDLIIATLQAIGINGLGAALLALGAHTAHRPAKAAPAPSQAPARVVQVEALEPAPAAPVPAPVPLAVADERPIAGVAEFAVRKLDVSDDDTVDVAALHSIYCEWAHSTDRRALSRADFEKAFVATVEKAGHTVLRQGRKVVVEGLTVAA